MVLADDSENDRVLLYNCVDGDKPLKFVQAIPVEGRPHFVTYDKYSNLFFVLSSSTGDIVGIEVVNDTARVVLKRRPAAISYARSITLMDGLMFLPSCDGIIYKIDYRNTFKIIDSYQVSDDMAGLNQIVKIGNYYYLTVYHGKGFDLSKPSKIIRAKEVKDFTNNKYEDITKELRIKGTPYFITPVENKFFLTEIDAVSGIVSFTVENDVICGVEHIHQWNEVYDVSKKRKEEVWRDKDF